MNHIYLQQYIFYAFRSNNNKCSRNLHNIPTLLNVMRDVRVYILLIAIHNIIIVFFLFKKKAD